MSVTAGWSIYEGLLTNILQTQKMEGKKGKKGILCSCLGELLSHLLLSRLGSPLSARYLEE